jgi:hypothetical protein
MKKTLLLTLAAGLVSTMPLLADVDLYITGSTAFRSQVHDACLNLFSSTPAKQYDTAKLIGGDGTTANSNPVWTFTGAPIAGLAGVISGNLTIHADFTGSVQGMQAVQNGIKVYFLTTSGIVTSNTATIAFSDVGSESTSYPVDNSTFSQENVAVQPFCFVKSMSSNPAMTNITNVTWEQVKELVPTGRLPLSAWTHKPSDTNWIYMLNRTKDSGTRRTAFGYVLDGYNQGAVIWNYDITNNVFYKATGLLNSTAGGTGIGVIGAPGVNNANVSSLWGDGYVGGGDIKNVMKIVNSNDLCIAYLSLADAKGINSAVNYSQVLPLNGVWPTAEGAAIASHGTTGSTNDFSPISVGFYGQWAYEVVVYPLVNPSTLHGDQNLSAAQLGNQSSPGTILGVLDSTDPTANGSLAQQISNAKPNGATAIILNDMLSNRGSVGGTISPF